MNKKIQYLLIDSDFVSGSSNNFTVTFGPTSNTFIEDIRSVIGIKLVDFYVTQIGSSADGTGNEAKYVDIYCPQVPTPAQLLSERSGQLFARVALERNFKGGSGLIVQDKQWKGFSRETKYFNPITIQKLNFILFEHQGDNDYVTLKPDAEFYMILEVTTLDIDSPPKEDPNKKIIEAIENLGDKFENFISTIQTPPPKPKQKIPLGYFLVGLILVGGGIYMLLKRLRSQNVAVGAVPAPMQVPVPGAMRAPGASRLM